MSIHRADRPNAPYRFRKSNLGSQWIWEHFTCDRQGTSSGREKSRDVAILRAQLHALGHVFDRFKPIAYAFGARPAKTDFALVPGKGGTVTYTPRSKP